MKNNKNKDKTNKSQQLFHTITRPSCMKENVKGNYCNSKKDKPNKNLNKDNICENYKDNKN